jgi:hypothetical protein
MVIRPEMTKVLSPSLELKPKALAATLTGFNSPNAVLASRFSVAVAPLFLLSSRPI